MEAVKFENNPTLPDIIELKNVTQEYPSKDGKGKVTVIKDLNMLIEDRPGIGQFVVILGASGCGKSTLLRYICGLQKPTSGEVLIRSKTPALTDPISMVFQQYSSLPWLTVLDNVCLGLKLAGAKKSDREEKGMTMLKLVGLDGQEEKFAKYPNLSGGQLQRVAIARCLLTNPSIILFDEPFGALDINTRLRMQNMLNDIWLDAMKQKKELTAVFVTHDIAEAVYLADEIWIMRANPGQIVERIPIDLPLDRTKELKRGKRFTDLVYDIEDKMTAVSAMSEPVPKETPVPVVPVVNLASTTSTDYPSDRKITT